MTTMLHFGYYKPGWWFSPSSPTSRLQAASD